MIYKKGFTLLESLIVIAIISSLIFSTLFSYRYFVVKNQLIAITGEWSAALTFARNTAMTKDEDIIFCARNSDNTCGNNWQNGVLIIDSEKNTVLRTLPPLSRSFQTQWKNSLGNSHDVTFQADGFTDGQEGSFWICLENQTPALSAQIAILRTGRIRVSI